MFRLTCDVLLRSLPVFGLPAMMAGCGGSVPHQPPGEPPTQKSVTREKPGGDAFDPQEAALSRQLSQPWGLRNDKDDQLHVPTVDWKNWKRVRYRLVKHFTGFRYGEEHHVMSLAFVLDVPEGSEQTTETCMNRFEAWARPQLNGYEVSFGEFASKFRTWRNQRLQVNYVDGSVDVGLTRHRFSLAWAAYPAYTDACLIYAMAVPWGKHEDLARQVRDRWVLEGFQHMKPLTDSRPYRKPE